MSGEIRIYLSASASDASFRETLAVALRSADVSVTHRDLTAHVEREIASCDAFLIVCSPASFQEPATLRELELAYTRYGHEPAMRMLTAMTPAFANHSAELAIARVLGQVREMMRQPASLTMGTAATQALTQARTQIRVQLDGEPHDEGSWRSLGDILSLLNDNASALDAYQESLRLYPDDSAVWCDTGATYMRLGQYEEALNAFEHALALDPTNARAIDQRGRALLALRRPDQALATYEDVLRHDESSPWLWHAHGLALLALGRADEAVASFQRAVLLLPEFSVAWCDMAGALRATGHWAEADTTRPKPMRPPKR